MRITTKRGLNIPIRDGPRGELRQLPKPQHIALNLNPFGEIRFRILIRVGDQVRIGQPLVESKSVPGLMFVSPAGGTIVEMRRGLKRRLLNIVIACEAEEKDEAIRPIDLQKVGREELLAFFMEKGLFPHIRLRPFNLVADPTHTPRSIFVTAVETRPFLPHYEMQLTGQENYFEAGLKALSKLTTGQVHLVYPEGSNFTPFLQAQRVEKHTASGPHPVGNPSLHIKMIDPIRKSDDYIWTLSALDTVVIGKMVLEGRYFTQRVISLAGTGLLENQRGYYIGRQGHPIAELVPEGISFPSTRIISGEPLTGTEVESTDFLEFYDTGLTVLPLNTTREFFHFFRVGKHKYSATRAYLSGHLSPPPEGYQFTTHQHGEERAFIDPSVYEKVMPLKIPTMHLIKAILAEDFEQAEQLGLLEVVPEDFALPTFICPSKIEMVEIVRQGLHRYAKEMGH